MEKGTVQKVYILETLTAVITLDQNQRRKVMHEDFMKARMHDELMGQILAGFEKFKEGFSPVMKETMGLMGFRYRVEHDYPVPLELPVQRHLMECDVVMYIDED